jgi:hypothetical protein
MKMTVAVCGAAGSMVSTFTTVLAIKRCKLPSEIGSMSVRFRCLFQVGEKTEVRHRRRLPMMHLKGSWWINQRYLAYLLRHTLRWRSNVARVQSRTNEVQEPFFVIEESCMSIQASTQTNKLEDHLGLLSFGIDTTHGTALAVNLRSV